MKTESFHRLTKALVDSGEVATLEDAQAKFSAYGIRILISPDALDDPSNRIIAMTTINIAARTFQGNVAIDGPMDHEVEGFPMPRTLAQFAQWVGIKEAVNGSEAWPTIVIGATTFPAKQIAPWASGWRFGLGASPFVASAFTPACVAAAALAVNEAFSILRRDNPYAGRRQIVLSLWDLANSATNGPIDVAELPGLWLVGLGHLGQAYAWTLGLMPGYVAGPIYLQDTDCVGVSTVSTSVLSTTADVDRRKSRVVAQWLEDRNVQTTLVERRFDAHQRVLPGEPRVALFGVDNSAARRSIESFGLRLAIDAGLGSGHGNFRGIRIRTFPGPSKAAELWAADSGLVQGQLAPAYQALLAQGADPCGVATLATRAVGAPFVGCFAAALVIAELVRSVMNGSSYGCIDLNLREPHLLDADVRAPTPP